MGSVLGRVPLERIGRDGYLFLEYERRGLRTILLDSAFRAPLQAFPPIELDGGCAYTQLLNPAGGLLGGDRLEMTVRLNENTHVLLTTPSATRVYRTLEKPTTQRIQLDLGPRAVLEWLPEILIPFAGSRFQQRLRAHLAPGAVLLLWDAFSTGRIARGERWAFSELSNELDIVMPNGARALERYRLRPEEMDPTVLGVGEDWDYFASFYVVAARPVDWEDLSDCLTDALDGSPETMTGAASILPISGLLVRIASKTAIVLSEIQTSIWNISRKYLLNAPAPALRKY